MKINHNTKKINYNLSSISSTHGFSLVELMVVVAIIGILASVAVPQFGKFQARARQAEAKTLLATLYTSEAGFYVEYNGYANSFTDVGFTPTGDMRYTVGFGDAAKCPPNYNSGGGCTDTETNTFNYCNNSDGTKGSSNNCWVQAGTDGKAVGDNKLDSSVYFVDDTNGYQDFTAGATAFIGGKGSSADVWQIDKDKNLKNTTSGL